MGRDSSLHSIVLARRLTSNRNPVLDTSFGFVALIGSTPFRIVSPELLRGALGRDWREKAAAVAPCINDLSASDLAEFLLMKQFALIVGDITHAINDRISPRDWNDFLTWAFGD